MPWRARKSPPRAEFLKGVAGLSVPSLTARSVVSSIRKKRREYCRMQVASPIAIPELEKVGAVPRSLDPLDESAFSKREHY